jgi:hypothetical protein
MRLLFLLIIPLFAGCSWYKYEPVTYSRWEGGETISTYSPRIRSDSRPIVPEDEDMFTIGIRITPK